MSLMTTWTTNRIPAQPPAPRAPHPGPRPAWDCVNCAVLNPGTRRRCTDCGTRRG